MAFGNVDKQTIQHLLSKWSGEYKIKDHTSSIQPYWQVKHYLLLPIQIAFVIEFTQCKMQAS